MEFRISFLRLSCKDWIQQNVAVIARKEKVLGQITVNLVDVHHQIKRQNLRTTQDYVFL